MNGADKELPELNEEVPGTAETVTEARLAIFAGLIAATIVAVLLRPPIPAHLTLGKGIVAAIAWLAASVVAGALGMAIAASVQRKRMVSPSARPTIEAAVAWILIPPLLLCWLRESSWALVVAAWAAAAIAVCFTAMAPPQQEEPAWEPEEHGPRFAALPSADSRPGQAIAVAVCLESAAVFLLRRQIFLATVLIAVGSFLLVQMRLAHAKTRDGIGRPAGHAAMSAVFAMLILVPLLLARFVKMDSAAVDAAQAASHPHNDQKDGLVDDAYRGIILFTVAERKKELPPVPLRRDVLRASAARPLVIPFNGSYWYFQAPQGGPGVHPHLAHGDPVSASIYSTGWIPLAMQAHQTLAQPVDLRSCGELAVAIRNGDNRPGRIEMGVLLTDTALPDKPTMYLGIKPIVSTEAEHFAIKKTPIDEELQFPIPNRPGLQKFDEITVFFFPDIERLTQGARIGIDHFELIQR